MQVESDPGGATKPQHIAATVSRYPRLIRSDNRLLAGLVGTEIAASQSPSIHEREADAHGLRLTFALFDLACSPDRLQSAISSAAQLGFAGLNVTRPFKQHVIPLHEGLSEEASAIDVIDTISLPRRSGDWREQ